MQTKTPAEKQERRMSQDPPTPSSPLVLTEKRGHVAILTLNRPDALNALGAPGDGDQVAAACEAINDDQEIRCVILTGAGRAFSAGGDVKAMKAREGAFGGNGVAVRDGYRKNIHRIVRAIYGLEVPSIAAVNGAAIGLGCDVACMTDIRIAADTAKFGVTFLKLGLIPGDGGAWLMPRTIGMSRAAELLFTGDVIDAAKAEAWGLISKAVPADTLMDEALALATRIAMQPPHALRMAKSLLKHGQTASYDTLMEMSAAAQAIAHHTEDHMEGVDAILEKRQPTFKGA
jgi:enoyl-CoA hydratase/carnithine racemase